MSQQGLEGRICLVTGATSGIGLETALGLAREGARVAIVGRNPERGEAARERIAGESGNDEIDLLLADLGSLGEIRKLADEVRSRYSALHILVNNAGVVNLRRQVTPDGFEATFAINHLAYFLLTGLLLPLLEASAPARIVSVASDAHRFGTIDFDDLQSERTYGGLPLVGAMRVYGASKLANILFTTELARRLEGRGVTANCVHPGAVATRLGQNNGQVGVVLTRLLSPLFLTPAQGAATSIHVATSPDVANTSGRYFAKSRETRPSRSALDAEAARRLWTASAEMVGLADEAT